MTASNSQKYQETFFKYLQKEQGLVGSKTKIADLQPAYTRS